MGKEFIEYRSETGGVPYSIVTLCRCLTQYVRNYISANREIIANIDKNVSDAVLVDAINYLGIYGGYDFKLYTKDLYSGRVYDDKVDAQVLLTIVQKYYAIYIFKCGIVESVLRNNHMNECKAKFDSNDGAIVIVDFINYLAQVNGYDKKFTIKDLYEKFKILEHKKEMSELKEFLEKTSKYSERLANGERIDNIFIEMAGEHNLYSISEDETYYRAYIDEKNVAELKEWCCWIKQEIEEEIYAMTYAYGKMFSDVEEQPQIEIINKKLFEMKRR